MIFVTENRDSYNAWVHAIESTVVQTAHIESVYHQVELLGTGSFGKVVLGIKREDSSV